MISARQGYNAFQINSDIDVTQDYDDNTQGVCDIGED